MGARNETVPLYATQATAEAFGAVAVGPKAMRVRVQVSVERSGRTGFVVSGLPSTEVKESHHRIRAAILSCGHSWPKGKITCHLSPSVVRKIGSSLDLPIAVAIIVASGQCVPRLDMDKILSVGELRLDGWIEPTNGVLCLGAAAFDDGMLVVPLANLREAQLLRFENPSLRFRGAEHLIDVIEWLEKRKDLTQVTEAITFHAAQVPLDFNEIIGQEKQKRAMEIAACGNHSCILFGPPGTSKTMLSNALPGISGFLSDREMIEVSRLWAMRGELRENEIVRYRPFRTPHFSTTRTGLIGGGSSGNILPGEISLAHRGILFLDELTEFPRNTIEAIRTPMEAGRVIITRTGQTVEYPCRFQLIAASNLCPCGLFPLATCQCATPAIRNYQKRMSGPMIDRLDLKIFVGPLDHDQRFEKKAREPSSVIRKRVEAGQAMQKARYGSEKRNADLQAGEIFTTTEITSEATEFLKSNTRQISTRTLHRMVKVARTIADLRGSEKCEERDISESLDLCKVPDVLLNSRLR